MVMTTFRDFVSKFRHYFKFSKEEIWACIFSVSVMAFIVSFREWGYGLEFEFWTGLSNFIRACIIVGIVLLVQLVAIKIQALQWGYRAEFKIAWYGLLIGLMFAFLTKGWIWILAPGGMYFHHLPIHRLGWFRYGVNMMETALSCFIGVLATGGLLILFKLLQFGIPDSAFIAKAVVVCAWFLIWSLFPMPPSMGSRIFFWSRPTYSLVFPLAIVLGLLIAYTSLNILLTLLFAGIFSLICWWIYLVKGEGVADLK